MSAGQSRRAARAWPRLALLVASSVLALLMAEAVVRFLGLSPGRCEPHPPAPVVVSEPFHYRLPANYRGELSCPRSAWNRPAFTVPLQTNAAGFRERPFPATAPAEGVRRIVVLGDSFAMGFGVRAEEALPARLQHHLQATLPELRHEVYNLGVWGMNTLMEANAYEAWGRALQPDLVVLLHVMNDAEPEPGQIDEAECETAADAAADSAADGDEPGFLRRGLAGAWNRAVSWSRFARTLHDIWRWRIMGREKSNMTTHHGRPIRDYNAFYEDGSPGWALLKQGLDELAGVCRRDGTDLVVALFPMMLDLSGDYPYEYGHRRVAAAARSRGLTPLDLRPAFAGFEGREFWITSSDNHPNAAAHDRAAAYLAGFLGIPSGAEPPSSPPPDGRP